MNLTHIILIKVQYLIEKFLKIASKKMSDVENKQSLITSEFKYTIKYHSYTCIEYIMAFTLHTIDAVDDRFRTKKRS